MRTLVAAVGLWASSALAQVAAPNIDEQRAVLRPKGGIAAQLGPVLAPLNSSVFSSPSTWFWIGLTGEGGVVLEDKLSVSFRVTALTPILGAWHISGIVGVDYALSDFVAIGAGGGVSALFGLTSNLAIMVPVRIGFCPWARGAGQIARNSLMIGLELAGGVIVDDLRPGLPPIPFPAGWAQLTVGYSAW